MMETHGNFPVSGASEERGLCGDTPRTSMLYTGMPRADWRCEGQSLDEGLYDSTHT
jgi:hypothetical protein